MIVAAFFGGAVALGACAVAQSPAERAAPPDWTDADLGPFFPDAREALVGARPAPLSNAPALDAGETSPAEFQWSRVIDADALATEIKRVATRLAAPLASPAAFKSGGNASCRTEFAMLAVLLAVVDQYDGEVRWQNDAAALRDDAARAAENCRTASDQSYAAAVQLRDDLDEMIRGSRLNSAAAQPLETWSSLADRKLLMQRMQRAMQEGISPQLSDAHALAKAAADVRQEAQVLAALAVIIAREEYDYWDDETFVDFAHELDGAAAELSRAAAEGDYEAARSAAGAITNACAACHDGYRG